MLLGREHVVLCYMCCMPHKETFNSFISLVFIVCLQGEKDWQKYETARRLKKCVDRIRNQYREDWKSKEMRIRQRAVALYFIDKVSCMIAIDIVLSVYSLGKFNAV